MQQRSGQWSVISPRLATQKQKAPMNGRYNGLRFKPTGYL